MHDHTAQEVTCGAAIAPPTNKREPQIETEFRQLQCATQSLRDSVCQLNSRLHPILREPAPCDDLVKDPTELVPLAQELRGTAKFTAETNAMVLDILERLEL